MPEPIPLVPVMTPHRFEEEVHQPAKFSHMVVQTDHLGERMRERGITFRQVLNALRKGSLKRPPRFNGSHATYEGEMTYHGTGREITVVCAIRRNELIVFAVTVY